MTRNQHGVIKKGAIKGRADIKSRLILNVIGDKDFAVAYVDPLSICNFLISPVIELNKAIPLHQEVRDGWDRILKKIDFKDVSSGSKTLIVSARNKWNIFEGKVNIIETAYIIDGSNYLHYLVSSNTKQKIPMTIIFGATESDEINIRRGINLSHSFNISDIANKVGTDSSRLIIDDNWKEVTIKSDPFVIVTGLGYTAAIHVIEKNTTELKHLIVGAKSLTKEIDFYREKFGTLNGIQLKIRKQSSDQRAPYEIFLIK